MQFQDVGAMLRLPMKKHGINNGCNFAAASVVCNLISGISVTIFQPAVFQKPDKDEKMPVMGSGGAFKEFVKAFYPDPLPDRRTEIADALYRLLRNPAAHALGVLKCGAYQLKIVRLPSKTGDGLTQDEVAAIEESPQRPVTSLGVRGSGSQWEIIVELLYRDALDMMVGLAHDSTQMQRAEKRFQAGTYVWRP